ncbi:MAG: UvrB/UvrC motif-containing protein [Gammaproteobacteria bacterium]|nr:UvrB/UvrC motif-containing protein [Gammaproteobacteria bacterium]
MERRRNIQLEYNKQHHITPTGIKKTIHDIMEGARTEKDLTPKTKLPPEYAAYLNLPAEKLAKKILQLEKEMYEHAHNLEFEQAAKLRDVIHELGVKS